MHVFILCTLNHTGSEELLINVLELQMHVALWGMETVDETVFWELTKKNEHTLLYTLVHIFLLYTLNYTGLEKPSMNMLEPWTHAVLWGTEIKNSTSL